ncbi:MAG: creatininase family protein [Planctomycetes bacterium]|nr:creatininase family protein [Planctomycetota bacterium]
MAIFSSALPREVRLEYMRPGQIEKAKEMRPAVYIPAGSMEWHGRQNAVGLDGLRAHELLVGLALRAGGVVFPPVFFGSGGEHGDFPYTYMVDCNCMKPVILSLLKGFERDGFQQAILLSGHGPNIIPSMGYLKQAADEYRAGGGSMRVLSFIDWMAPGAKLDHAGRCETSAMMYYHPETVDMKEISGPEPVGLPEPEKNWMADIYKQHPCYGICKPDPRGTSSAEYGKEHSERVISFLHDWLDRKEAAIKHLRNYSNRTGVIE